MQCHNITIFKISVDFYGDFTREEYVYVDYVNLMLSFCTAGAVFCGL